MIFEYILKKSKFQQSCSHKMLNFFSFCYPLKIKFSKIFFIRAIDRRNRFSMYTARIIARGYRFNTYRTFQPTLLLEENSSANAAAT